MNMRNVFKKINKLRWIILTFILCAPTAIFASETGVNPWENVLQEIANSFTGPVAYAISIIAIVCCGIMMAFADLQGGAKQFVQTACGLSIAFFATQIVTQFLGFSGALI